MTAPIAAIFGVGGKVGKSVALKLLEHGYQVAAISRSGASSLNEEASKYKDTLRQYRADLSQAGEATRVWKEIKKDYTSPISIVFYNPSTNVSVKDGKVFDISVDDFRASQENNTVSMFAVAKEAIKDFSELPSSVTKAFIYTGNGLDDVKTFPATPPNLLTLKTGKQSSASIIEVAAKVYGPSGYCFYYLDERIEDGTPAYSGVNGPAHAKMVWDLSQRSSQGPWRIKFTIEKGVID